MNWNRKRKKIEKFSPNDIFDATASAAVEKKKISKFNLNLLKVFIARDRFSSDIVEILPICYFMLLKFMCEVSKLLTIQISRKLSLQKKF